MEKIIYILDTYAFIYRSYYAFSNKMLVNKDGFNVSAVFGFFKSLYTLLKTYHPPYFVAALDSKVPTFRHNMYKEYKATRQKTPEDLHAQIPIIEEILKAMGIATFEAPGFEADDVIASITKSAKENHFSVRIISKDKDLLQLLDKDVKMIKQDSTFQWITYDESMVEKEWGLTPHLILDYLSITGDASDNVPGVKGVGAKGAQKLLCEYGSLEGIYDGIDNIKGALKKKLLDGRNDAFFSRRLIKLDDSIKIEDIESYSTANISFSSSLSFFEKLELPTLYKLYKKELFNEEKKDSRKDINKEVATEEKSVISSIIEPIMEADKLCGALENVIKKDVVSFLIWKDEKKEELEFLFFKKYESGIKEETIFFTLSFSKDTKLFQDENTFIPISENNKIIQKLNEVFLSDTLFIMYDAKNTYKALKELDSTFMFPKNIFDVMIASYLIYPDKKDYSFSSIIKTFIDANYGEENITKENIKSFHFYLPLLYDILLQNLKDMDALSLFYEIEMPLTRLLGDMERLGIKIDKEDLKTFAKELDENIKDVEKKAYNMVGCQFNIASYKELQSILFEKRDLKPQKKSKTGFSTSSEVLEKLKDQDPIIPLILDYRLFSKLRSTYTDSLIALADSSSRLHTHFIQTGTATGRLSSKNPNLQNIPSRSSLGQRIRRAFCGKEGCLLISSDYSQIELRVLAHLSSDEKLISIIKDGVDVHKRTAALIFGSSENMIDDNMRAAAKAINFGVIYGMSAYRLSEELNISVSEASSFISSYFDAYKGVKDFIKATYVECEKKGYVSTIMGRRRYVPEIKSDKTKIMELGRRIAVNTRVQGSASDIMKKAMLDVDEALKKAKLKTSILLQVHDEIILESPIDEIECAMELIKTKMEAAYPLLVPLSLSISKGKTWSML